MLGRRAVRVGGDHCFFAVSLIVIYVRREAAVNVFAVPMRRLRLGGGVETVGIFFHGVDRLQHYRGQAYAQLATHAPGPDKPLRISCVECTTSNEKIKAKAQNIFPLIDQLTDSIIRDPERGEGTMRVYLRQITLSAAR